MRNNSHKCTLFLKKANTLFNSLGVQFCCLNTDVSLSKNALSKKRRNDLFSQEKSRQHENVGRVEKIEVHYAGKPEDVTLVMNKDISTPFNCAQHMSEMLMRRSALALVDKTLWDMHRPLESGCQLELLHFKDPDPYHVNKAFWRTCSFLLGAVAEKIFKDNVSVQLHSFPSPNVKELKVLLDFNMDDIKKLRQYIKKRDADHNQLKRELVLSKDELEQYQK
uniref:(California timema) hypothetical protein n=1 Tax=Timema californicum TaxID=61474 RepID=A0A7R9PCC2_TIMCA|nr:unnamed protein product [Timema californicum]